jgi:hypothetical protein
MFSVTFRVGMAQFVAAAPRRRKCWRRLRRHFLGRICAVALSRRGRRSYEGDFRFNFVMRRVEQSF